LVQGLISPQAVLWVSAGLYTIAAIIGLALIVLKGAGLLWFILLGAIASFF
jgi:hypothetical protein